MHDVSALVARQYEEFPYPEPVRDLARAVADGGYQMGDPSLWSPLIWPEGAPLSAAILVAGCGTTQAAWLAFTNPTSKVFGVDLSEPSLAHARFLQDKHQLTNLTLYQGDLLEVGALNVAFDLVISTGVLHHMADPDAGMAALARVIKPDGAFAGMVYGATRRTGVYMLQDAFRRLGMSGDVAGVAMVKDVLAHLPRWHFAQQYIASAEELRHDAAIVDTFLHPQDRAYTVPQVLALVEESGLAFQGWFDNSFYYPDCWPWVPPSVRARLEALPDREVWAVMEMLRPAISTHSFFARRGAAPILPFDDAARLAPQRRPGLQQTGRVEFRRDTLAITLGDPETRLLTACDGKRSVADLAAACGVEQAAALALFRQLWRSGHVMATTLSS